MVEPILHVHDARGEHTSVIFSLSDVGLACGQEVRLKGSHTFWIIRSCHDGGKGRSRSVESEQVPDHLTLQNCLNCGFLATEGNACNEIANGLLAVGYIFLLVVEAEAPVSIGIAQILGKRVSLIP